MENFIKNRTDPNGTWGLEDLERISRAANFIARRMNEEGYENSYHCREVFNESVVRSKEIHGYHLDVMGHIQWRWEWLFLPHPVGGQVRWLPTLDELTPQRANRIEEILEMYCLALDQIDPGSHYCGSANCGA